MQQLFTEHTFNLTLLKWFPKVGGGTSLGSTELLGKLERQNDLNFNVVFICATE